MMRGGARPGAGRKPMKEHADVQFRMPSGLFDGLERMRLVDLGVGKSPLPRSTWYCTIVEKAIDAGEPLPEVPLRNGAPRRRTRIWMPGKSGFEIGGKRRFVDLYGRAVRRKSELGIDQMAGFVRRCLGWYVQGLAVARAAFEALGGPHAELLLEREALHDVPDDLVARCVAAAESGRGFSLALRCEILDALDRARMSGARSKAVLELFDLSGRQLARWRRERMRGAKALDALRREM